MRLNSPGWVKVVIVFSTRYIGASTNFVQQSAMPPSMPSLAPRQKVHVYAATARGIQRTVADGIMRKSVTSPTLRKTVTPTTRSAPHFAR
jgi:hypothetical protein